MARSVVGYIPSGFLNSAANASVTGSTDAETGLPISTGLVIGTFQEFSDAEASLFTHPINTTYVNTLFSGTYMWVALDPAVTGGAIVVGTPLFWLQSQDVASGQPTVTTVVSGNNPDFAGVSIDPNFGPSASTVFPNAFIQMNGKATCLFGTVTGTPTSFGDPVGILAAGTGFDDLAGVSVTAVQISKMVGIALGQPASATASLVRINRAVPTRW